MGCEKSHSIPMDITSYQLILWVRRKNHRTYSFLTQGGASSSQSLTFAQGGANNAQPMAGGQGQCETLTVSSVSGNTIVAKSSNGSSVTIHTTASTSFRQAGKTVTASAITVGARIHVMGTHNSDGSITATSIDIG